MTRLLDGLLRLLVYAGVASLLVQGVALALLGQKGLLHKSQLVDALAVVYDVKVEPPPPAPASLAGGHAGPTLEEIERARRRAHLDLDLREMATENSLQELRALRDHVQHRREIVQALKSQLQSAAGQSGADVPPGLDELRTRLEVLQPKQAKDQLQKILSDPSLDAEQSLQTVVALIQEMPLDRRKKILSEFKDDAEMSELHRILRQMREGHATIQEVDQAQKKLEGLGEIRPEFAPAEVDK